MQLTATERSSFGRVMKTSLGKCKINWPTAAGILDLGRLTRRSGKGSSNVDSSLKSQRLHHKKTIFSNAKCVILVYMAYLSLSHLFLICVKTWSLNKT